MDQIGGREAERDSVGVLGGISATLGAGEKLPFGLGAVLSSFVFFFTLGYGASWVGGYLKAPQMWRRID